ncbi:glycosyltransferase family 92 protein [Trichonephila inaurata madagascariensis]|uniref:Glycosyltransferase family 92 protein n=1 Tax=Trichonephila inaurata madagascariensis TaxID=2747483 RepID=A0A8X6Y4A4_9ARAC|nr:glycosyltransferase family 92 protein [Trichonephila inaurata madagascariensis]
MIFPLSWHVRQCKKFLILVVIYGLCTFFIVSYLKSKIYPKKDNCFVNESFNIKSKEIIFKVEANLKYFLEKDTNISVSDDESDDWVQITEGVFIYSAYIDKCPSIISSSSFCVQFIGISLMNITDIDDSISDIKCAFKRKSNVTRLGFAFLKKLNEHHFKPYTAAFFYCDLKDFTTNSVSINFVTLYKVSISTWVRVNYLEFKTTPNVSINLCVRPLYGLYPSINMIEFLTYYKMMGVEHFVFYRYNISASMHLFLKFLKSTNLSIEIRPWNVPLDNELLHEFGQMVFTQDCIVRNKYKFSHTIIVDIDEYIVPKLHLNITSLIVYLDEKHEDAGSYVIPMALFCDEFSYDSPKFSLFHILNHNKRQKTFWKYGYRSKYIVRSGRVLYGGIHFIWKHERNWHEVEVSDTVALLHHYRRCCGVMQTWFFELFSFYVLNDDVVIDNSLIDNSFKLANDSLVSLILNLLNVTSLYF